MAEFGAFDTQKFGQTYSAGQEKPFYGNAVSATGSSDTLVGEPIFYIKNTQRPFWPLNRKSS